MQICDFVEEKYVLVTRPEEHADTVSIAELAVFVETPSGLAKDIANAIRMEYSSLELKFCDWTVGEVVATFTDGSQLHVFTI